MDGFSMKEKTIFRDQSGSMSMIRWFLFIIIILSIFQFTSGIIISFIIVIKDKPDFISLAIALFSGTAIETGIGMIGKVISKKFEEKNE